MSERNPNSPRGSFTQAVDKRIGDAFPVVEAVYNKLAQLTYLAENLQESQPQQIEIRGNEALGAVEWRYVGEPWNVLVEYSSLFGVDRDTLFADLQTLFDNQSALMDVKIQENETFTEQGSLILSQVQNAAGTVQQEVQIHSQSADHDNRYLRSQVAQSGALLNNIPIDGVTGLRSTIESLEAAIGSTGSNASISVRLALLEASSISPLFDQAFGYNNEPLDLRTTFSRTTDTTYLENGAIKRAKVDEPVFEGGGLRLTSAATNLTLGDLTLAQGTGCFITVGNTYGFRPTQEYQLTANTSATPPVLRLLSTGSITASTYTVQAIFKAGTRNISSLRFRLYPDNTGVADESRIDFSLNGGGSILFESPGMTGRITLLAGNRYLCSATITGVSDTNLLLESFAGFSSGTAGGETLFLSNAQTNTGRYAPYIYTTTVTGTKEKDNFSIQGAAFKSLMNPLRGTILLDIAASTLCTKRILRLSDSTEAGWELRQHEGKYQLATIGGEDATISTVESEVLVEPEARNKIAISWSGSLLNLYVKGVKYGPMVYSDVENIDKLVCDPFANTSWINLYRMRIYNTAMSDEHLTAITL